MNRELMHTETVDGFTIKLYAMEEDHDWRDDFDPTCSDFEEIAANLDNGVWVFYAAQVTASKAGLELGCDYLGSCMYEPGAKAFMAGGYYADMRDEAIGQAQQKLRELAGDA